MKIHSSRQPVCCSAMSQALTLEVGTEMKNLFLGAYILSKITTKNKILMGCRTLNLDDQEVIRLGEVRKSL